MNYDMQLMIEHAMRSALNAAQAGPPDALAGRLSETQIAAIQSGNLTALFFVALGLSLATDEPVEKITARVGFPDFAQGGRGYDMIMRATLRQDYETEHGTNEPKH